MAGVENNRTVGILKLLFLLHLILSSWGMQSVVSDHPDSYLYYNLIFMAALIWAIVSKTGLDSTSLAIVIAISCTVLDILTLSLYWRGGPRSRVYFGFAIANAVLRAITSLSLMQLFRERDVDGVGFSGAFSDIIGPMGPVQSGASRAESTPVASQQTSGPTGYQAV